MPSDQAANDQPHLPPEPQLQGMHLAPQPASAMGLHMALEQLKQALPQPELPAQPELVALYWRSWELAARMVRHGSAENGFSASYVDAAFGGNIFQWDTCFIAAFARYSRERIPILPALDNFYRLQEADGYIAREYRWENGAPLWAKPSGDSINPPLFSWAEWQIYRVTGDQARLRQVWAHLDGYYRYLHGWHRNQNGTYWITDMGSGMDNTPRYGAGWIDLTAQQALNAATMATIADEITHPHAAQWYRSQARELANLINALMWDSNDGFYWDIDTAGLMVKNKTVASFWPLLAGITNAEQNRRLIEHLRDPNSFWRTHPFPTLAAEHPLYKPHGDYWLGAVWAPTNYMIIKGLDQIGATDFAHEATLRHLAAIERVYRTTNTVWENYCADDDAPGKPARPDFVGWTGCAPIALLIEDVIGVTLDAAHQAVEWDLREPGAHGIRNLPFGTGSLDLVIDAERTITVRCDQALTLKLSGRYGSQQVAVDPGEQQIKLAI